MYQFILLIHVFVAIFIIALVLIQQGKGATMGAAFGSGASQTVFGSRGSGSFMFRLTIGLIAMFFVTSIGLNYLGVHAYKAEKNIALPMSVPQRQAAPAATPESMAVPAVTTPELPVTSGIPKRQ